MNRPQLYHQSLDRLVDAFYKGTLQHGNACACAVGNLLQIPQRLAKQKGVSELEILKGRFGGTGTLNDGLPGRHWSSLLYLEEEDEFCGTGYLNKEALSIEFAFEESWWGKHTDTDDNDGFLGLMAVVDVLGEIHGVDQDKTVTDKSKFVKPIPV